MEKSTTPSVPSPMDVDSRMHDASTTRRFERPSLEAVSLCCEISAYAPDGDDRPLF